APGRRPRPLDRQSAGNIGGPGSCPTSSTLNYLLKVRVNRGALKLQDDFFATRTTFGVLTAGKRSRFYFQEFVRRPRDSTVIASSPQRGRDGSRAGVAGVVASFSPRSASFSPRSGRGGRRFKILPLRPLLYLKSPSYPAPLLAPIRPATLHRSHPS